MAATRQSAVPATKTSGGYAPKGSAKAPATSQDRERSEIWINIGYTAANGEFVSFPYNLALDTMSEIERKGELSEKDQARNEWLRSFVEEGRRMEPGATQVFTLECQLLRTSAKKEPTGAFAKPSLDSLRANRAPAEPMDEPVESEDLHVSSDIRL